MPVSWCILSGMTRYVIQGPLTYELALKDSPIRRFFDDRLTPGLKDAQAAYRADIGPLLIHGVPREAADAGTIGTAADWMLRFLMHPNPSLALPRGAPRSAECFRHCRTWHSCSASATVGPIHSPGQRGEAVPS